MRKASVITTTIDAFRSAINGDVLSLRQHPPILPQKDKDFLRKELSQIENDLVTEGVNGELLLNGMLICAGLGDGAQALRYLHRYRKRCFEIPPVKFFEAVALFLNGKECLAQNIIRTRVSCFPTKLLGIKLYYHHILSLFIDKHDICPSI